MPIVCNWEEGVPVERARPARMLGVLIMTSKLIERRDFLQKGALGAAAVCLGAAGTTRAESTGLIDAHVHVWTPDTKAYPLAEGYEKKDMQPASFTPEELFSHAKPVGVNRIVLIQMSFYGFDNRYMTDMMAMHKGVFSGVAVIDENDHPRRRMLELKELGVRGFRIAPRSQPADKWLTTPGMVRMWKCGAENGLAMCPLIDPVFLPSVDAMCEKNPDTPVVVDHFARVGIDGTVRKEDLDNLCRLARHKNTHVKVSAFYALGKKKAPYTDLGPMIRRVLDAFGPERLMWASDCPFQVENGHTYAESINLIKSGLDFLSQSDKDWLLRKTAERVYFSV